MHDHLQVERVIWIRVDVTSDIERVVSHANALRVTRSIGLIHVRLQANDLVHVVLHTTHDEVLDAHVGVGGNEGVRCGGGGVEGVEAAEAADAEEEWPAVGT